MRRAATWFLVFVGIGCGDPCRDGEPRPLAPSSQPAYAEYRSDHYSRDESWLCRPGLADDACRGDLSTTELKPDGTLLPAPHVPSPAPAFDCFYVYPTVDLLGAAGLHDSFTDLSPQREVVLHQGARFSEVCAVYAPLYRQVTLPTYTLREGPRDRCLEIAFSDVHDAFLHYLGQWNGGRDVALLGHSQGGEMVMRLGQEVFDDDAELSKRLVALLGIGSRVTVARGSDRGGSFENLPACRDPDQRGCVVAYRSIPDGGALPEGPDDPGEELLCVNPVDEKNDALLPFSRTYLPRETKTVKTEVRGAEGLDTRFLLTRERFAGRCVKGEDGEAALEVSLHPREGETTVPPLELRDHRGAVGLHNYDYHLPLGDLIDLVERKSRAPRPP